MKTKWYTVSAPESTDAECLQGVKLGRTAVCTPVPVGGRAPERVTAFLLASPEVLKSTSEREVRIIPRHFLRSRARAGANLSLLFPCKAGKVTEPAAASNIGVAEASRRARRDASPRPSPRRPQSAHSATARPTDIRSAAAATPRAAPRARRRSARRRACPAIASIAIMSPSRSRPMGPPTAASGPTWPTQKPRVAAGEAPVGDERHRVPGALPRERRRRRQHLAHARAAARPLIADHEHVARLVLLRLDRGEALLLAVEAARRARGI